jgi:hypothetical protein
MRRGRRKRKKKEDKEQEEHQAAAKRPKAFPIARAGTWKSSFSYHGGEEEEEEASPISRLL